MNIKSLLLGSAAALIAVSGARAADAVTVAEPEPAQYVKICDVYGTGYFYIPGTETCLRIGGYVRYDAGFGDVGSLDGARTIDRLTGNSQSTWNKNARFTLKTWTGQETELGTLKTYTETRFNWGTQAADGEAFAGNKGASLNFAWIQLGGLRIGRDDSAFDSFSGYAGNVIQDTLVPYGGFDTNLISYTLDAGNGFSAIVSLEQGSGSFSVVNTMNPADRKSSWGWAWDNNTIDSYVPHVVGGVKYTQGWGSISAVGAYNSNFEEWSGKVRLDVNATSQLSLFVMGGYGTNKHIDRNFYKPWGGNWAVWGGGTYKFNEKASFNAAMSYDQDKNFGLAANVAYELVPGFTITPEVDFVHTGKSDNTGSGWAWNTGYSGKRNSWGGIVRFQRSF